MCEVAVLKGDNDGTGELRGDEGTLQFMCQPYPREKMVSSNVNLEYEFHTIRNGQSSTGQVAFKDGASEARYINRGLGLHEPAQYYQAYHRRKRNPGENCQNPGELHLSKCT